MITLSNENRRTLQKILDRLNELEKYESQKEKLRTNSTLWLAVEMLFVKSGELMKKFRDHCKESFSQIPVFKTLTGFRDILAHKDETEVEIVISAFNSLPTLKNEVEKILDSSYSEDIQFSSFEMFGGFGTRKERQKYIDALTDKLSNSNSEDLINFPKEIGIKPISDATEAIINHPDLLRLSHDNSEIAKEIAQDISKWAKNVHKNLIKENPFEPEEDLFHHISNLEIAKFVKQLPSLKKELTGTYNDNELNFPFYSKKNREIIDLLKHIWVKF